MRVFLWSSLAAACMLAAAGCSYECSFDTDCSGADVCAGGACGAADLSYAKLKLCDGDAQCGVTEHCVNGFCWPGDYIPPYTPPRQVGGGGASAAAGYYNFEESLQGWWYNGGIATIRRSTNISYAGGASLEAAVSGSYGSVYVQDAPVGDADEVTFHVWIPRDVPLKSITISVSQANGERRENLLDYGEAAVRRNAWNTLHVNTNGYAGSSKLAVSFASSASWTGFIYVDSVGW